MTPPAPRSPDRPGPLRPRGVGLGVLLALLALLLAACGSTPAPSPAAATGASGADGAPGADGSDGASGTDGADGTGGAEGADGADGADGEVAGSDGAPTNRDVQQVEYLRPITALDLETAAGAIEVVGDAPADTVRITRTRSWRGAEPVVTDTWTGTVLTTRVACDSCGVAFEVHVPPQVATRLVARSGGVRVDGLTGDAELRSSAGGVRATGLSAGTVTATSRSGGVRLDLATAPDAVTATTSAGAVEVTVPGGTTYAVDAATDAGRVRVDVPTDPAAPRRVTARSAAGSVSVRAR